MNEQILYIIAILLYWFGIVTGIYLVELKWKNMK